jgi:hypothetical protein
MAFECCCFRYAKARRCYEALGLIDRVDIADFEVGQMVVSPETFPFLNGSSDWPRGLVRS